MFLTAFLTTSPSMFLLVFKSNFRPHFQPHFQPVVCLCGHRDYYTCWLELSSIVSWSHRKLYVAFAHLGHSIVNILWLGYPLFTSQLTLPWLWLYPIHITFNPCPSFGQTKRYPPCDNLLCVLSSPYFINVDLIVGVHILVWLHLSTLHKWCIMNPLISQWISGASFSHQLLYRSGCWMSTNQSSFSSILTNIPQHSLTR